MDSDKSSLQAISETYVPTQLCLEIGSRNGHEHELNKAKIQPSRLFGETTDAAPGLGRGLRQHWQYPLIAFEPQSRGFSLHASQASRHNRQPQK